MRIVTARRISQGFFLVLFFWFCVVATVGDRFWQLRGWPINWFLWFDPLTALSTALATGTLFAPLLWAVAALGLTLFLGRFFCGFACPLGTLQHLAGYLSRRRAGRPARIADNRPSRWQGLKYPVLVLLLAAAALGSVQTGLLDPLSLVSRSVNLAVLPLVDPGHGPVQPEARLYDGVWVFGLVFVAVLALAFLRPRFFCRFLCPLGALYGLVARFAPWRMGKRLEKSCGDCHLCEEYCEGGCRPSGEIVLGECVLCCNCLDTCPTGRIGFAGRPSTAGERALPDVSRRGAVAVLAVGALSAPLWRVGGGLAAGKDPALLRPPGSLDEDRFLARCIRCGQCMRVCPSNIIHPAVTVAGAAGLWTPVLNYRLSRAGCLPHCIACGQVCPTAAIRPFSIEERLGLGEFSANGPLRLGTAFVDRTRCLPWAMGRPCIVCQEVCPVSPKAIFTREVYEPLRNGRVALADARGTVLTLAAPFVAGRNLGSGDYYLRPAGMPEVRPLRIAGLSATALTLERPLPDLGQGREAEILVRLQQPHVDPGKCIGCGMCEHECPVSGLRAIRVTNENESRSGPGRMLA